MKLLFAPDSFKGSLSAVRIAEILQETTRKVFPDATCVCVPIADGGEGTMEALYMAMGGTWHETTVTGPLGAPVQARWLRLPDGERAVLEMAEASGLPLVPVSRRDPRKTTSYGTGEMILSALEAGVREILLGIGGSATNDAGAGMLAALGAVFYDADGNIVEKPTGADLSGIARMDLSKPASLLKGIQVTVMCDVRNPLLGTEGATFVYGPQKGADPGMIRELETGMQHFAKLAEKTLQRSYGAFEGAGAAGGIGAALGDILHCRMQPGLDAILELVRFEDLLDGVDLVVTGEGQLDAQSVRFGKVPTGIARHCKAREIPVIALAGSLGDGSEAYLQAGNTSMHTIVPGPVTLQIAMEQAETYLAQAFERVLCTLKIGMQIHG